MHRKKRTNNRKVWFAVLNTAEELVRAPEEIVDGALDKTVFERLVEVSSRPSIP